MPRLSIGLEQVFTNLGIVGDGYKLFFFETGTTTPKTTYSDEGLTIQNTNPIVLNSAGRPDVGIWGSDPSLYRMILGTPDSVLGNITTVVDVDPVDNYSVNNIAGLTPIPTAFWGTTAGTSSNYTLDPALVDITSYSNEQTFFIDFHTACAANPDITINNLPVLDLKKKTGQGTKVALVANDVNGRHVCTNDGADIIVLDPYYPYLGGNNITQCLNSVIISNNGSDPNNDIDFSASTFSFSDGTGFASLSAITKRLDATWAAGTNQGGLDTGAKANSTWYYCYAIFNPTTQIADALFTASFGSPTLPSGYTKVEYRGAIRTDSGGNILPFTQIGNKFLLQTMVQDYTSTPAVTAKTDVTTTVPPSFLGIYSFLVTGHGTALFYIRGFQTAAADPTPDATNSQFAIEAGGGGDQVCATAYIEIPADASSQISYHAGAGSGGVFYIRTAGWIDPNII